MNSQPNDRLPTLAQCLAAYWLTLQLKARAGRCGGLVEHWSGMVKHTTPAGVDVDVAPHTISPAISQGCEHVHGLH
jgi:hypothetical protein